MADKFKYSAISRDGVRSGGVVEAEDEQRARSLIDSEGFIPISIKKIPDGKRGFNVIFKSEISLENLSILTRKLLTLNRAGIPILRSLNIIVEDVNDPKLEKVLIGIRRMVEGGSNLTEAFENYAGYFPDIYISTIRAGEESGSLDKMLAKALELMEREARIKNTIKSAVRYPSYVLITIGLAFLVIITFVVPKFAGFYSSYGAELPWATRLLMDISGFLSRYWPYLIFVIPASAAGLWRLRLTAWGRRTFDYISIAIPIIGKLLVKTILSRFCYILSTLLSAGLPLSQALSILKSSIGNYYFSKVMGRMGENLIGGGDIIQPMRESKYFSPMVIQMFSIGLESGSLESLLQEAARYFDIEIEQDSKKLTSRIEPLLTLLIGVMVLIMALAIFLPMWNMISIFKK